MQYQEAVAEARQLVKRSEDDQWRLAQLTAEVAEQGTVLKRWAEDTSMSYGHVKKLRQVWLRFGAGVPGTPRRSFTEAYALVKDPTLADEPDIGAAANREEAKSAVRNMPPEQKAEVVREAMASLPKAERAAVVRESFQDEEVAEQALADDDTARAAVEARAKTARKREAEQREAQNMRAPQLANAGDLAELGNNMAHIATRLELLAEQVQRTRTDQRDQFAREWADIKRLVGWVDSVLSGESMDEGLTKLLDGGDQA